jgi:hypothetical protein
MDDPIKVIWKYKNKNRRHQYNIYIFIGNVESNILTILNKIKNESLYSAWSKLSKSEISSLEKKYGNKWYNHFYNTYHINSIISIIKDNNTQTKELIDKFGKDWYKLHIESPVLVEKKIIYSYEALIKGENERKIKKQKTREYVSDLEEDNNDYKTIKTNNLIKYLNIKKTPSRTNILYKTDLIKEDIQDGGQINDFDIDKLPDQNLEDENPEDIFGKIQTSESQDLDQDELLQDELDDMQDIEDIYKEEVPEDKNLKDTTKLLKQVLKDNEILENKKDTLLDFDNSKDNNMYDENLRDVYSKLYITNYYIFKDDSIKTIKDKICCSMKNNNIFDENSYLLPSRQYLWTQYVYQEKIEKIMVGMKWIKRNELLPIDIEPNTNIRYYEELRANLKLLRDNLKRYGSKIRWEDDDNNILYDYEDYMMNNELYLLDIYNDLGLNYNPDTETKKNIQDVYCKLYFPKIRGDDLRNVFDFLKGDKKLELTKMNNTYETITNDIVMESEIMNIVEDAKKNTKYKDIFKDNYITQSVIHLNLRVNSGKIDLFRIFNEFEASSDYPFIQYQTPDGQVVFKFKEEEIYEYSKIKDNSDILTKWFENTPIGVSFKVRLIEKGITKFIAINLNENGRIEYKTQWKEEDMAKLEDITNTYQYIRKLITQLNTDKNRVTFENPDDSEFKYAFINTIQKFELPEKFTINHNDLSEFSRFLYPYVSMVIEPRKRQAKVNKGSEASKFGTYLRYKRVSKYDNHTRIEQRIMYFIRNYEVTDSSLANEISKQFNITIEQAIEEVDKVRKRHPNLRKARKVLKKLENIPKYKPPGIGIDIQGKQRENYKVRISGARSKSQLFRMIDFMNILLFLYMETYLLNIKERQIIKEKLKKLNNIAKRRSKVDNIVDYEKEVKEIKQMAQLDKQRIGFKPEKGQNQWSRSCQNSGDKNRQPQQYNIKNMDLLIKNGFKLNKKTGIYEKRAIYKKGSKSKEVLIKTVKLKDYDEEGNPTGNEIHYACDPEKNGEYYYVGFLTKSTNPFGHCMPCCYKKDFSVSKNKEKRDFYNKCLGEQKETKTIETSIIKEDKNKKIELKNSLEKLYILLDTNKIQEGRFGFLPTYLDFFFNYALNKKLNIKGYYLTKTETGYFFKYGTKQDDNMFLNSIGAVFDKSVDEIKENIITCLDNDKNDVIFTALNNGDIKTQFTTKENYIQFIKYGNFLEFDLVNHILSIPKVISPNGLNIIIFSKQITIIKKELEKEKSKEDFFILCQTSDETDILSNKEKDNIFILKEVKNYYPIIMAFKKDENSKSVDIIKTFKYEDEKENIVSHIKPFYDKNCNNVFMNDLLYKSSLNTAKDTKKILESLNNKNYLVKFQIIDIRNKCKYLVLSNNILVPVRPSGSLYNINILYTTDKFITSFENTFKNMIEITDITNKNIDMTPIGVYYSSKKDKKLLIVALITKSHDIIPIQPVEKLISNLEDLSLTYENKPLYENINEELSKPTREIQIDDRIKKVNLSKFNDESYELFRLELSEFINREENNQLKKKLEKIIYDNLDKKTKIDKIRLFVYRFVDKNLYKLYKNISQSKDDFENNQEGGTRFINLIHKLPKLDKYQVTNERSSCTIHNDKEQCTTNPHCVWGYDKCYLGLTKEMMAIFVNKISEELALGDLKSYEIMKLDNYFVSDIGDYSKFKQKEGQKIIRSSSNTMNKTLGEIFGKENIPHIGKRKQVKTTDENYQQLNLDNNLRDMDIYYVQKIINKNYTLMRAYVNAYYWFKNPYYEPESRNLGYYSHMQTDLLNFFRSLIIDWINDNKNHKLLNELINKYMDKRKKLNDNIDIIVNNLYDSFYLGNGLLELNILYHIHGIPINILDNDDNIIYNIHENKNNKDNKTSINLRYNYINNKTIPDIIEVLYYK